MSNYAKPQIIVDSDLAEGVFAASGAGIGSNVSWVERSTERGHKGEDHYIRKYDLEIPAAYIGQTLHYKFTFTGPIRHAGLHHQITNNTVGTTIEGDVSFSANNDKYVYVCVNPEYAPDGLNIVSGSITIK